MASLPPQSAAPQRRQSQTSSSPAPSQSNLTRRASHAPSVTSEDSQTVLLNDPSSISSTSPSPTDKKQQLITPEASSSNSETQEPRKCWICFTDESEDTPLSSEWRSPCPCALTAHESCLLDWIADLEAPTSRKRTSSPAKILCPQCKSEITVARPRSFVIECVRALERITGRLILPGVGLVVFGCVYTGCVVYGLHTINMIFGPEDMQLIVRPDTFAKSWRLKLGLPLVPVVLVASRTTLADSVLPVLPILFFATQTGKRARFNMGHWPPSAAMSLAVLPYLRGAYNEIYERVLAERERRWIKEVQPRAGETGDEPGAAGAQDEGFQAEEDMGDDVVMGINLEVQVIEDDDEGDGGQALQAEQPAAEQAPIADEQEAAQANPEPAAQAAPAPRQNNLIISTANIADTVLGALIFPTISAAMGELLKLALPKSWTSPITISKGFIGRKRITWNSTGILQERWGRSIVGGCLFVVLKDVVVLYSRWQAAQNHRKRRVVDYDKKKGRGTRQ
ncbi:MAG: hypothetical protein M1835_006199 [Candelina submexicana]|nr:MAG: hypothetical protein M1835_006199 [Candelina submexicana]